MPNDHVGDFDGVAHLVVDLQDVAVERAGAYGDLGGKAARCFGRRLDALAQREPAFAHGARYGIFGGRVGAHAAAVERVCPAEALVAHGALVVAEEDAHARLPGLQGEEAGYGNPDQAEGGDAESQAPARERACRHAGLVGVHEPDNAQDEHGDDGDEGDENDAKHAPARCGLDLLFHAHECSFREALRLRDGEALPLIFLGGGATPRPRAP